MSAIWRRTQICRDSSFRKEPPGARRSPGFPGSRGERSRHRLGHSILREPSPKPASISRMGLRFAALSGLRAGACPAGLCGDRRAARQPLCRAACRSRRLGQADASAQDHLRGEVPQGLQAAEERQEAAREDPRRRPTPTASTRMHIVGAIVGEHTYNVDAYDRLQTYYVKAVSYLDRAISFSYDGERHRRLHPAAGICGMQRRQGQLRSVDLPRSGVGPRASAARDGFPNDRFSATFFQPFYAGQTFGIGQLNPLTALEMSDLVAPRVRAADARQQRSARRLQDHHGSRPDAALCRGDAEEVDRRLQVDRRLRHLAEPRPDRDALQSRQSGGARPRAQGRERTAARSKGSDAKLPEENYYGWLVNEKLPELQALF